MLSNNIITMLDQMDSMHQTETQLEAARDLREQLEKSAQHQACLRCAKSGWTAIFDDSSKDRQKYRWVLVQTGCGAYRSLPQDDSAGFGFSLATGPATIYHCDIEAADAGVGKDEAELRSHRRWPSPTGEAEREQATPRRDGDRGC